MGATVIAVVAIVAILAFALRGVVKRLKGESDCCGGGGVVKAKEKKLEGNILGTKTVHIEGMTCEHCKANVERAVNDIPGAACKVNLKENLAKVSYDRDVDDEKIRSAIERMNYVVTSIE